MQIRTRLTFSFSMIVSGILLAGFVLIYFLSSSYSENEFYGRLRDKANTTAELLIRVEQIDTSLLRVIDRANRDVLYRENITVFNYRNEKIYSTSDTLPFRLSRSLLNEVRSKKEVRIKEGELEILGILYTYRFNRFVVLASAEDQFGHSKIQNLRATLVALYILLLLIVSLTGWFFSGRALQPIANVMNEVEEISPGSLNQRLVESSQTDEIGRLAATFNKMLDRIEKAFKLQKTFVANVSHEMRNPLAKITSQLEVSLLKERSSDEYQATVRSVLEDIRELNRLSGNLLSLAKVSSDEALPDLRRLRMDELLFEARDQVKRLHPQYKVQLDFQALPEEEDWLFLQGNEQLLRTAVVNLMENGCKFSDDHTVRAVLYADSSGIKAEFRNRAAAFSEDEIPFIFQPFYRSRSTADIRGHGIGLSLVERIVRLHGGRIEVKKEEDKVLFLLRFPPAAVSK